MWHRFTTPARKAISAAEEEAARLGARHVAPVHLFLGLLQDPECLAVVLLRRIGLEPERLRATLEGLVVPGPPVLTDEPFLSPRAKRATDLAFQETRRLDESFIGTEHLLLGLLAEGGHLPARVLAGMGADLERARAELRTLREEGVALEPMAEGGRDDLQVEDTFHRQATRRAWMAVLIARAEAGLLGAEEVLPEHLLLALTRGPVCAAMRLLEAEGVTALRLRQTLGVGPKKVPRSAVPFSQAAREVLGAALEERQRLQARRAGTQHLLLALLRDGEGWVAEALRLLRADLERLRVGAEGEQANEDLPQPWKVPVAPQSTGGAKRMWQRFTERARRVVFFAQEEAARQGQNYVGTEHLLLALVRESDSVAGRILERLGISPANIRTEIERQVTQGHGNLGQDMQLTPRAKRVIDLANEEARQFSNDYIGTEHILLGLIREGDGLAARVLQKLGADLERTRGEVLLLQEQHSVEQPGPGFLVALRERLRSVFGQSPPPDESAATPGAATVVAEQEPALDALRWIAEQDANYDVRLIRREALDVSLRLARQVCEGLSDLRSIQDLNADQAWALLCLARVLKATLKAEKNCQKEILPGCTLAMIFEKPSLRTRVSFETGMFQLGGHAIYLQPADISMGKREPVADVARNLERMVEGIMARVFAHATIEGLAEHARIPVINGLCDREHPCQALADLQTVWEKRGAVAGQKLVYVGDGNNVAHSLMLLGAKLGAHVVLACPEGYDPLPEIVAAAEEEAAASGGSVQVLRDPFEAVRDADVVYTDVWASMGQEDEASERAAVFQPYQVREELVALAKPDYLFLHCLPAHREEEVTTGVLEGPNSGAFDQAENRLHAQKAVLAVLLG